MWASSSSGLASSSVQRLRQTSERYLEAILTADVEDPSENTGPGGDLHLTHHQAKEGLHCMRTDAHAGGDLFTRHTLQEKMQGFPLAWREVELLPDHRKICRPILPFEHQDVRRGHVAQGLGCN